MSSSPSRAASPPASPASGESRPPEVLPFAYREAAVVPGRHNFSLTLRPEPGTVPGQPAVAPASPYLDTPPPGIAADPQREAQLRELGRQEGALQAGAKFEERLAAERGALARALADFARDRAAYYRKIEEEAVQLALAIARKVIHREAQVDPLLLSGIVRVALERMEGATQVTLRVAPQSAAEWRKQLAAQLDAGKMPEIVEDEAVAPQQCVLRTAMGTADLGLEVHLKEIEKGLTDLLAARPGEKP
jgi:flagellar assembly protein FliH